jgi:hypothetical protein
MLWILVSVFRTRGSYPIFTIKRLRFKFALRKMALRHPHEAIFWQFAKTATAAPQGLHSIIDDPSTQLKALVYPRPWILLTAVLFEQQPARPLP